MTVIAMKFDTNTCQSDVHELGKSSIKEELSNNCIFISYSKFPKNFPVALVIRTKIQNILCLDVCFFFFYYFFILT